jgi:PTS system nitrogen regulatory IIA component
MTESVKMREILSSKAVTLSLDAVTKKDVIVNAASQAAALIGQDAHSVFDVLWERERLGTTGVGQGIAIPHGRVPGLDKVVGYFARLAQPVNFESVDDKPVDLVFVLLAPQNAGADHLQALASVSRTLRDAKLCEQLRKAKDAAGIYKILTEAAVAEAA